MCLNTKVLTVWIDDKVPLYFIFPFYFLCLFLHCLVISISLSIFTSSWMRVYVWMNVRVSGGCNAKKKNKKKKGEAIVWVRLLGISFRQMMEVIGSFASFVCSLCLILRSFSHKITQHFHSMQNYCAFSRIVNFICIYIRVCLYVTNERWNDSQNAAIFFGMLLDWP